MSDHHLHLHAHADLDGDPVPGDYRPGLIEEYVESAARIGVSELGFTEHLYRCVESTEALGAFWQSDEYPELGEFSRRMVENDRSLSLEGYVGVIQDAKDAGLPVQLGLEIDYFPDTIDAVLELIEPYPWDFLIGAVHWIGPFAIDTSASSTEVRRRGVDRVWRQYFELMTELAGSSAVDVLAHVDLPKKYGLRPDHEPIELYEGVVRAAAASGTAVEVSSQGLRNPAQEEYPSPTFLQMFYQAGVQITLASDGHAPEQAGQGIDQVVAAARQAGYTERLTFSARQSDAVRL